MWYSSLRHEIQFEFVQLFSSQICLAPDVVIAALVTRAHSALASPAAGRHHFLVTKRSCRAVALERKEGNEEQRWVGRTRHSALLRLQRNRLSGIAKQRW